MENDNFQWINPLFLAIFHSYVNSPEGIWKIIHVPNHQPGLTLVIFPFLGLKFWPMWIHSNWAFYSKGQSRSVANPPSPSDKEDEEEETQQGQCLGPTRPTRVDAASDWCHGMSWVQPCYRHDDGNQDVCWAKAKLMQHLRFTAIHRTRKSICIVCPYVNARYRYM